MTRLFAWKARNKHFQFSSDNLQMSNLEPDISVLWQLVNYAGRVCHLLETTIQVYLSVWI
jgi:hypothetical protein